MMRDARIVAAVVNFIVFTLLLSYAALSCVGYGEEEFHGEDVVRCEMERV